MTDSCKDRAGAVAGEGLGTWARLAGGVVNGSHVGHLRGSV